MDTVRSTFSRKIRLPMILRDGIWEPEFGGTIPVADGTKADLQIELSEITDKEFARRITAKSSLRILDRGTTLRAYLTTKTLNGVSEEQRKILKSWSEVGGEIAPFALDNWSSGGIHFVDLSIGGPTEKQAQDLLHCDGGLWLMTEGTRATGLISSLIDLPKFVSEEPAISLNHAFTLLSETYEPWRKSHTGNVYTRFLYRETNGLWYPLELLRNAQLAQKEMEIAAGLWQRFMQQMSSKKL